MTGSSIFDYVHQADHAEIAEQLGLSLTGRPGQAGLNSPASGSEEGSQHGTNNPDGEFYFKNNFTTTSSDVTEEVEQVTARNFRINCDWF